MLLASRPVLGPLLGVLLGTGVQLRSARPTSCAADAEAPDEAPDDMTIGEMTRQLAQVRAYYHEQGELEQQHVDRNLLASRIDKLRLNRCRVASSNIHGNGLFATRAIEEGEFITFYPGDAVILWLGGQRTEAGVPDETGVIFGAHVPDEQRDVVAALEYATEALAPLPPASNPRGALPALLDTHARAPRVGQAHGVRGLGDGHALTRRRPGEGL